MRRSLSLLLAAGLTLGLTVCQGRLEPPNYEETLVGTWTVSAVANRAGPPFTTLELTNCGDNHAQRYQELILADTLVLSAGYQGRWSLNLGGAIDGVPLNSITFSKFSSHVLWFQIDTRQRYFVGGYPGIALKDTLSGQEVSVLRVEPDNRLARFTTVVYRCPGARTVDSTRDVIVYYSRI